MSKKWVYLFKEGEASKKSLLGGKGANLSEMSNIGLPVPPGFTVTTEACTEFYNIGEKLSEKMVKEIYEGIKDIEDQTGKKFGDLDSPLLVSVRSGAAISMPGMMDTILNLGLNDDSVIGLSKSTVNERFAYDSYRRFIQMFSDVVLQIPKYLYENVMDDFKDKNNYKIDTELTPEDLKDIVKEFKNIYIEETGTDFPQDPKDQLLMAIEAVFKSWDNPRAVSYRNINELDHKMGTAVNVQSMVFGNMGDTSGTGVAFTRNPATGEKKLFGEFLINAQGEDVVAGIRTPKDIQELKDIMPQVFKQFKETCEKLENHYKDMQDIEFTIEKGKLYFLQTRTGERTAQAALKIVVDMEEEGVVDIEEGLMRIEPKSLDQLLHPTFDIETMEKAEPIAKGLPASPGAASGKVYFTAEKAVSASKKGVDVILVRKETSPEDIEGMNASKGILTSRGGMTSHAAVVARGMGKCCVAGCENIKVNEEEKIFSVDGREFKEGELISVDGTTGKVYEGKIKTVEPNLSGDFAKLMVWADEVRTMGIRANADTPKDSNTAVKFGAEGIGLCRTEHMFFDEDRVPAVRRMILADTKEEREKALKVILPMQKEDLIGIYKEMKERPVTIRLLDPPLHEFLPHEEVDIRNLAEAMEVSIDKLKEKISDLEEFNPMLGHRGCRLAVTYPEIAERQTRAIVEAAVEVFEEGVKVKPEIMIPLVGIEEEMTFVKKVVKATAEKVLKEKDVDLKYLIGTMIEIPRASLIADDIAKEAEFFSFGTNDLTQMGFGFSRDDRKIYW